MSQSKYSFPNPTPPHDSNKTSYKPITSSLSTTTTTTTTMTTSSSSSSTDINLSSLTPPPIPSPTKDPFSRSLAPLEPQHPSIPSYLNTQRRGSITDPSLHLSVPNPELSRQYSQPDVHFSSNSSERRSSLANVDQYPLSPSSTLSRPSSVKSDHQLFSSLESRKLRDSTLPSISASPSPVRDGFPGSLMNPAFQAQLQTRRHSIAVGEVVSPLKRKSTISGLPLPSSNNNIGGGINSFSGNGGGGGGNSSNGNNGGSSIINHHHQITADDYPVKRRESIGDPAIQRLSLYDRRSSYSAPSSPPALPSLSSNSNNTNNINNNNNNSSSNSSNNNNNNNNGNNNILPKLNHNHHNSSHRHHNNSSHHSHHPHHYDDLSSDHSTSNNGLPPSSSSHLSEHNDSYPQPPPPTPSSSSSSSTSHHFNNPRLSQIVHDENAPILARRASMPIMPFGSRFSDHIQDGNSSGDGGTSSSSSGGGGNNTIPMDIDRFRGNVYSPQHHHHHAYHPYAYEYSPGYIQPQQLVKETPYSRSPELRISHKLAERKRRKEMKELFDELRDSLPVDKSLKTSKWEILSKAVDYINNLKQNQDESHKEIESLRQQLSALKGCSNDNNNNNNNNNNNHSNHNNHNHNNNHNNKPSIS